MSSDNEFVGLYRHQIDDKGRLAVPSKMRALLAGAFHVAEWFDTCLAILPDSEWDRISSEVSSLRRTDPRTRALERRVFGKAVRLTLDGQGRILLPQHLREFAGLEGEVVFLGLQNRVEIWSKARWDAQDELLSDETAFAQFIDGIGI